VGTQLLQAAEQEAHARGCQYMILDSYDFQAPGFYQKHGYEVFAVLEDHPPIIATIICGSGYPEWQGLGMQCLSVLS